MALWYGVKGFSRCLVVSGHEELHKHRDGSIRNQKIFLATNDIMTLLVRAFKTTGSPRKLWFPVIMSPPACRPRLKLKASHQRYISNHMSPDAALPG